MLKPRNFSGPGDGSAVFVISWSAAPLSVALDIFDFNSGDESRQTCRWKIYYASILMVIPSM